LFGVKKDPGDDYESKLYFKKKIVFFPYKSKLTRGASQTKLKPQPQIPPLSLTPPPLPPLLPSPTPLPPPLPLPPPRVIFRALFVSFLFRFRRRGPPPFTVTSSSVNSLIESRMSWSSTAACTYILICFVVLLLLFCYFVLLIFLFFVL
jgi:hypothetical protein